MTATHKDMANAIRFLAVDAVQQAKSGHPGMPMGMADVATVLYSKFLKFDPKAPHWQDRDRFVLSAGHGSMLMYSLLYLSGYDDISMADIRNFRQMGSKTAGHPEYGHVEGIETTTGPLGQGITTAVGMALAEKMQAARYGDDIVSHATYVIAGDGCLMEGISQEAISIAGHMKLSKLTVMWDDNEICIDGNTNMTLSDNQCARFEASGWDTQKIDGHDGDEVVGRYGNAASAESETRRTEFVGIEHGRSESSEEDHVSNVRGTREAVAVAQLAGKTRSGHGNNQARRTRIEQGVDPGQQKEIRSRRGRRG